MRTAVLLVLSLGAAQALAQDNAYGYLGFFGGSFDYEEDLSEIVPGQSFSDSTTAVRVYGGYRFGEWFSVEGSYGVTDNLEGTVPLPPPFTAIPAQVGADYEFLTVNALGFIGFDKLSLFGGIGYWDADVTASVYIGPPLGPFSFEETSSDNGTMYTVGMQWDFEQLAVRAEYDWFDTDDPVDASMFGVGLHWLFGR